MKTHRDDNARTISRERAFSRAAQCTRACKTAQAKSKKQRNALIRRNDESMQAWRGVQHQS